MREREWANCLGLPGFTGPPIGKALAANGLQEYLGSFGNRRLQGSAAIEAEIELFKTTYKFTSPLTPSPTSP